MSQEDIGFMQVQLKIYRNAEAYDFFAINAYEQKYCTETDKLTAEFEVLKDAGGVEGYCVSLVIKFKTDGATAVLLIPVHQSDEWEVVKPLSDYTIGFYCILGEVPKS